MRTLADWCCGSALCDFFAAVHFEVCSSAPRFVCQNSAAILSQDLSALIYNSQFP